MLSPEQKKRILAESLTATFPDRKEEIDSLIAILDLLPRMGRVCDKATRKLATDFLGEAQRDTATCKLLYSKKSYPHAVYHLQQGVEKAIKGHVLAEGYFSAAEIKKLMIHQSPMVILKAVLERTGIKAIADEPLKTKLANAEAAVSDECEKTKIAVMSHDEIMQLLSQMDAFQQMVTVIESELRARIGSVEVESISDIPFQKALSTLNLLALGIITFPHESYTRYPGKEIVPSDYTRHMGVVRAMPQLLRRVENEVAALLSECAHSC